MVFECRVSESKNTLAVVVGNRPYINGGDNLYQVDGPLIYSYCLLVQMHCLLLC